MKKLAKFIIIVIVLVGCKKSNGFSKILLEPNSIWEFSRKDFTSPGNNQVVVNLVFKDDGYVYEQETILFYHWSTVGNNIILNNNRFDVLESSKNKFILHNPNNGQTAELRRVK